MDRLESEKRPAVTGSVSKPEMAPLATMRTHYKPANEEQKQLDNKINRKLDMFLLGILAFDFMIQGIDRSNAGFAAASSSFIEDANLQKNDIADSLSLFSVTYVTLQPFATAVARKLGAKNWIAIMLLAWGTVSMCHAAINSTKVFFALRMLLGVTEAGFTQTSFYYLASLYPKEYLGFRIGMFAGMYAMANAFAGLIATGVLSIDSASLKNWQILYLLEGGITILLSFLSYFILPASPSNAWMLSADERVHAVERMNTDIGADPDHVEGKDLTKRDILDAIRDWRKLVVIVANIVLTLPVSAFSTFLPLIVLGMDYKGTKASLMSVPPFLAGFVGLLIIVYFSDKTKERCGFIILGEIIALIGLVVMITSENPKVRYAFTHICLSGAFAGGPLVAAWIAGDAPLGGPRVVILGINGWANLSGVIAGQLFKHKYAPSYNYPLKITLILIAVVIVILVANRLAYMIENRRRLKITENWTEQEFLNESLTDERRGDHKYTYIYGY